MIIPAYSTGYRPILKQLPASYMEPLKFSFSLDIAGLGDNVEFGLCRNNNTPIIKYNLRDGFVYDYSGRLAGTYQSGLNNFNYNYHTGQSWQYINKRLVSSQDKFSNYTSTPFEKFYIKNNSNSEIDLDLSIQGFSPPTLYSQLSGNTILSGSLLQSGLAENPGQSVLYQVFNISVPSQYGQVNYFQTSGTGEINYTLTGGSYAPDDVIPITFNTYWGNYTVDVSVSGAASVSSSGESGIFLNLYGNDNLAPANSSLDFYLDYYSSSETPVTIELEMQSGNSRVLLSGSGQGIAYYEGYISRYGTLYARSPLTGIADLQASYNTGYNTQYTLVDRYLTISKEIDSSLSTYFTGVKKFTLTNIDATGIYMGPDPGLIGKVWAGKGIVDVTYNFEEIDEGIHTFNGVIENVRFDTQSPNNNTFQILPGYIYINSGGTPSYIGNTDYLNIYTQVSNAPEFYPNSAWGFIQSEGITVLGEGDMVIEVPTGFFGSGLGTVSNTIRLVNVTATGNSVYRGRIDQEWFRWEDYELDKPATPTSGGALVRCSGFYNEGLVNYQGGILNATGELDNYSYTWGYGSGPSSLILSSYNSFTRKSITSGNGITGFDSAGDIVTRGFTGFVTGHCYFPATAIGGPIFGDPKDSTLRNFPPVEVVNASGNGSTKYGRSCVFGEVQFSLESIGLSIPAPNVNYTIRQPDFTGYFTENLSDFSQVFYTNDLYPTAIPAATYPNSSVEFLRPETNPKINGVVFEGEALAFSTGIVGTFNLIEADDEQSYGFDYTSLGWVQGNKLKRPTAEIFPAESYGKYLKVEYLPIDETSQAYAILRVAGGGSTGEIYITGNNNGAR